MIVREVIHEPTLFMIFNNFCILFIHFFAGLKEQFQGKQLRLSSTKINLFSHKIEYTICRYSNRD